MKILYVITKSTWGGAQKYVYDLSSNLPRKDFDVVVAAGGSGKLIAKLETAEIRTIKIPFLQRDINLLKETLSLVFLFKIFRTEKPDIIHLNSSKVGGLGAVTGRLAGLITRHQPKIIFTAHGWGFNEDRRYIARVFIFLAQWITVLFCHKIIILSKAVYNQAMYFPFSKHKMYFTEQGAEPPVFLPKKEAKKELVKLMNRTDLPDNEFPRLPASPKLQRGETDGQAWVVCVAELTKNKGLAYLIEAAALISRPKFYLFIIGNGEDKEKLENQINGLNLNDKIFLVGFLDEASRYLKAFDIFILPSVTEALGYVLIEAAHAGLPVIATKVGGIPTIVKNEESGLLVPPKKTDALAEALKKLLGDADLRKRMGKKNRELISKKFSFEKMLKETVNIYTNP